MLDSLLVCAVRFRHLYVITVFLYFSAGFDVQAQDNSRFLRWMYEDAAGMISTMNHRSPLFAVGTTATLVALSPADPRVLNSIQTTYKGSFAGYLDFANRLGDPEVRIPLFSIFAVSMFTDNERFQDAAFTSIESWFYAGLITMGLKTAFGRARPESGSHSQIFEPFSGNTSFPSGHTSAAFAIVTPWVMYYPNAATYALFALSTGTALARIALDKHWPTDVVAGAAIGYFTGRFLSRRHIHGQTFDPPRINVNPELSSKAVGVSVKVRLSD